PARWPAPSAATGRAPGIRGEHPEIAPANPALVIWRDLNSSSRAFELFTHSKPALEPRLRQTRFSPDHPHLAAFSAVAPFSPAACAAPPTGFKPSAARTLISTSASTFGLSRR